MVTAEGGAVHHMVRDKAPHDAVQDEAPVESRVEDSLLLHSLTRRRFLRESVRRGVFLASIGALGLFGALDRATRATNAAKLVEGIHASPAPAAGNFITDKRLHGGSLNIEVAERPTDDDLAAWPEREFIRLNRLLPACIAVNEEIFGPPMPWVDGLKVLICDSAVKRAPVEHPEGVKEVTYALNEYKPWGTNIVFYQDTSKMSDSILGALLAHEIKHSWGWDDRGECTGGLLVEGLARMVEIVYVKNLGRSAEDEWERFSGYNIRGYDRLNTPSLSQTSFCSEDLSKYKAQMQAGAAWYKMYKEREGFFLDWAKAQRMYFISKGRPPGKEEQLELARQVFPGFEEWRSKHWVLNPPDIF